MTLIRETTPKARTAHRCDECSRQIAPGAVYVKVINAYGGDFTTYRAHLECSAASRVMNAALGTREDEWFFLQDDTPGPNDRDEVSDFHRACLTGRFAEQVQL